jgi:hypothetical protein
MQVPDAAFLRADQRQVPINYLLVRSSTIGILRRASNRQIAEKLIGYGKHMSKTSNNAWINL